MVGQRAVTPWLRQVGSIPTHFTRIHCVTEKDAVPSSVALVGSENGLYQRSGMYCSGVIYELVGKQEPKSKLWTGSQLPVHYGD